VEVFAPGDQSGPSYFVCASSLDAVLAIMVGKARHCIGVHMRAVDRHEQPEDDKSTSEDAKNLTPLMTPLRIEQLGWSRADAADVRSRLHSFADDWDDPDMDVYDAV
jgi:hypothetical protein